MPEWGALPLVSVIVVNYRGAEDTITCLRTLGRELDYPAGRLELICVDNASRDGSAERIRAAIPQAKVLEAAENLGFAAGCNFGVKHANGEVLAFLNNDARPHRNWVRAAVRNLLEDPTIGAVASKVLDWDGERIDFVDAGLTWFGMGHKPHVTQPDDGRYDVPKDVLFPTGAAMFARADVFGQVGGFDERFFMFFEDVDLGWRLNLLGWRVRYEPRSLAYHRHHASMSTLDHSRELYLLERNALAMLYKNLEDSTLSTVLPAALTLAVRRATARGDIDPTQLEITRRPASGPDETADVPVARVALAGVLAIDRFAELLPQLEQSRRTLQANRKRSDRDLMPLMRQSMEPLAPETSYRQAYQALCEVFGIAELYGRPRKIVILTEDTIADRMAGPAIRAWNIAAVLSTEHEVRLVSLSTRTAPPPAPFAVFGCTPGEALQHIQWSEIVVFQGHIMSKIPQLITCNKIIVCDVYDPMHLEQLEQAKDLSNEQREAIVQGTTQVLTTQLRRGDFFLCASDRQRHFWLGHLAAIGRLGTTLYDADPSGRSLLAVAPFGLPSKPPQRTGKGIKGSIPGISNADKVVIWAGGVYNWFDPLTLIRAVDLLRHKRDNLRLFFLGMRHPNPEVPEMSMARQAMELAKELGVVDKHVFFNQNWVAYQDRQNYLLDSDCGVTTHFEHVETTFAFRTRVLDYLWAGLPVITTDGDSFADLVNRRGLGAVVPDEDPQALADALERVLYDEELAAGCRDRIAVIREQFTWENALAPLVEFCRDPRPAADRLSPAPSPVAQPAAVAKAAVLNGSAAVRRDLALVKEYLTAGGPAEVAKRAAGRLRRIAAQRLRGNG